MMLNFKRAEEFLNVFKWSKQFSNFREKQLSNLSKEN